MLLRAGQITNMSKPVNTVAFSIFVINMGIFSPFYPLRLGEILALPCPSQSEDCCCQGAGGQHHPLGLSLSRASFPSWLGVPLTSLAAQNRLYSLDTSMPGMPAGFRGSAADWWFSLSHKARHLAFPHMACRMFSCHCWHPFGARLTPAVSGHVVAMRHYLFTLSSQH